MADFEAPYTLARQDGGGTWEVRDASGALMRSCRLGDVEEWAEAEAESADAAGWHVAGTERAALFCHRADAYRELAEEARQEEARQIEASGLRRCRFRFVDEPTYAGWTDGSTWNGFLNVWVTPEVRDQIADNMDADEGCEGCYAAEPETLEELRNLTPDANGLIDLSRGWAAELVED